MASEFRSGLGLRCKACRERGISYWSVVGLRRGRRVTCAHCRRKFFLRGWLDEVVSIGEQAALVIGMVVSVMLTSVYPFLGVCLLLLAVELFLVPRLFSIETDDPGRW